MFSIDLRDKSHFMSREAEPGREEAPRAPEDGVDLTLIRWMARLTTNQRLAVLQDYVDLVGSLHRAKTD